MGVNKQGMVPVEYSEVMGGQGAPTGQIQVKGYKRFESLPLAPKVTEYDVCTDIHLFPSS